MQREGPPLESLLRRLAETPAEFLAPPRIGSSGQIAVAAVARDVLAKLGGIASHATFQVLQTDDPAQARFQSHSLLMCWLLADDYFLQHPPDPPSTMMLIIHEAPKFSAVGPASSFVTDPERREELVRTMLDRLGLRPAGESLAQAQDRFASVSSTERTRVLKAARDAEARARSIREALARKAAEDSADKWTRE